MLLLLYWRKRLFLRTFRLFYPSQVLPQLPNRCSLLFIHVRPIFLGWMLTPVIFDRYMREYFLQILDTVPSVSGLRNKSDYKRAGAGGGWRWEWWQDNCGWRLDWERWGGIWWIVTLVCAKAKPRGCKACLLLASSGFLKIRIYCLWPASPLAGLFACGARIIGLVYYRYLACTQHLSTI